MGIDRRAGRQAEIPQMGVFHMRAKNPVIVRSSYEQQSLRSRFSNGMTSVLRRVSPARWGFSGGTLMTPELIGR
jgi:hypothetical protein